MKKKEILSYLQKNYGWIVALITGVSIIITFILKFIKYIYSTFYFYYYGISYELFNSEELNILYNFGFSIVIILCFCSLIYCYIQLFNSKKLELKTKAFNIFLIIVSNMVVVYSINSEYSIWNFIINTCLLIVTEIIMTFISFKKQKKEGTETRSILNSLKALPFYLIFVVFVILFKYGVEIKMNKTYRIIDNNKVIVYTTENYYLTLNCEIENNVLVIYQGSQIKIDNKDIESKLIKFKDIKMISN